MSILEYVVKINAKTLQIPSPAVVDDMINKVKQGDPKALTDLKAIYKKARLPKTKEEGDALIKVNRFIGREEYTKYIDL